MTRFGGRELYFPPFPTTTNRTQVGHKHRSRTVATNPVPSVSLEYHSCTVLLTPHASQDRQTAQTKGFEADRQSTGQRRKSAVRAMSTAPMGVGQKGPRVQCAVRGRGVLAREGRA